MFSFGKQPGATASQRLRRCCSDNVSSGWDCLQLLTGNLCTFVLFLRALLKNHQITLLMKNIEFSTNKMTVDKIVLNVTRYHENLKTRESCRNQLDHLFWALLQHADMMDEVQVKHWQPWHRAMDGWMKRNTKEILFLDSVFALGSNTFISADLLLKTRSCFSPLLENPSFSFFFFFFCYSELIFLFGQPPSQKVDQCHVELALTAILTDSSCSKGRSADLWYFRCILSWILSKYKSRDFPEIGRQCLNVVGVFSVSVWLCF